MCHPMQQQDLKMGDAVAGAAVRTRVMAPTGPQPWRSPRSWRTARTCPTASGAASRCASCASPPRRPAASPTSAPQSPGTSYSCCASTSCFMVLLCRPRSSSRAVDQPHHVCDHCVCVLSLAAWCMSSGRYSHFHCAVYLAAGGWSTTGATPPLRRRCGAATWRPTWPCAPSSRPG